MNIAIVSIFPEMFEAISRYGVSGRAISRNEVNVRCFNPRDYTEDRHRTVDERPYGGGPGMVMMPEPLEKALAGATDWLDSFTQRQGERRAIKVVYLSPQGEKLKQQKVNEWADCGSDFVFIAGRYEGIDERFVELFVDCEISIGDYVLSGGELAVMVVIDAIVRLLPGVLGDENSAREDSFMQGLLDCPHYTRPTDYRGRGVPKVLLSGDHAKIAQWRFEQAVERTRRRRPDLLVKKSETGGEGWDERLAQYMRGLKIK